MCSPSVLDFIARKVYKGEVAHRLILEIGSHVWQEVNFKGKKVPGTPRVVIEPMKPLWYVGVDLVEGAHVDLVWDADNLMDIFAKESFHVVIATELLEHAQDWRKVISNIKQLCKPGGVIVITTCSPGYPKHMKVMDYWDYWRFSLVEMEEIFSDCAIHAIEPRPDSEPPGIRVKVVKPLSFVETDLSKMVLNSVV